MTWRPEEEENFWSLEPGALLSKSEEPEGCKDLLDLVDWMDLANWRESSWLPSVPDRRGADSMKPGKAGGLLDDGTADVLI